MSKTTDNLWTAFAGESQANRKYLAFAEKADREGYPQVARLFRAAAAAETVHAHSHLRVLGEVKTTAENLQAAVKGENYEAVVMYPEFLVESKRMTKHAPRVRLSMPSKLKKSTNSYMEVPWKTLVMNKKHMITLCALSADLPMPAMHRKPAQSAVQKGKGSSTSAE